MSLAPLTPTQARVLLHKHVTGEFPRRQWVTIERLMIAGMLALQDVDARHAALRVTETGRAYCDAHHQDIRLACRCHPGL